MGWLPPWAAKGRTHTPSPDYGEFIEGFSHEHKDQGRLADGSVDLKWILKICFRISGHLRRFIKTERGEDKMGNSRERGG